MLIQTIENRPDDPLMSPPPTPYYGRLEWCIVALSMHQAPLPLMESITTEATIIGDGLHHLSIIGVVAYHACRRQMVPVCNGTL